MAAHKAVTSATQRQKELYAAPQNVTLADGAARTTPSVTMSTTAALARLDRAQAALMRAWGADLERAQRLGDWRGVASVRAGLEASAVVLEECAGDAGKLAEALEAMRGGAQ